MTRQFLKIYLLLFGLLLASCSSYRTPESNPTDEARYQISKEHYGLLGLAVFSERDYWIPGYAGHKEDHNIYGVNWHGVSGLDDPYIEHAEPYMKTFNQLILKASKGIVLDVYRRGPNHKDYIHPSQTSTHTH